MSDQTTDLTKSDADDPRSTAVGLLGQFLDIDPDKVPIDYENARQIITVRRSGIVVVEIVDGSVEFIPSQSVTAVRFGDNFLGVDTVRQSSAVFVNVHDHAEAARLGRQMHRMFV